MKDKFSFYLKNWKTMPNFISLFRIILIPIFAERFYNGETVIALIILAFSGISDLVDGKIARRFNQVSNLGKILDPVTDKLTVFAIAIIFYLQFSQAQNEFLKTYAWVFLLFVIKDVVMVVGAFVMILFGMRPCAAEIYGKIATTAFYLVMVLIMAIGPEIGVLREYYVLSDSAMYVLVSVAEILSFIAFFSYMPDVFRQVRNKIANKKMETIDYSDFL